MPLVQMCLLYVFLSNAYTTPQYVPLFAKYKHFSCSQAKSILLKAGWESVISNSDDLPIWSQRQSSNVELDLGNNMIWITLVGILTLKRWNVEHLIDPHGDGNIEQ